MKKMKKAGVRKSLEFFKDNIIMIRSLEAPGERGCAERCLGILQEHVRNVENKTSQSECALNKIAVKQVKEHLLMEMDKCNAARINAIKEDKINSEIAMWSDMQIIYGELLKQLDSCVQPITPSVSGVAENNISVYREK